DGLMLRVEPVFLAGAHPLAEVSGKGSGVCCYGHASDVVTVMGTGAGGPATASAVVSDIVEVALGNWRRTFLQWPVFGAALPAQTAPAGAVPDSRFYIRCAPREPRQATTQITAVLRDQGVEALRVELLDGMACAPDRSQVVVLTAPLPPGKMPTVLAALEERVDLLEPPVSLPLIEPS
ncbi:MAG: hypothetical protein GY842_00325, partial [bacterium]|nr:hypothetical protein [bacterium]